MRLPGLDSTCTCADMSSAKGVVVAVADAKGHVLVHSLVRSDR